MAKSDPRVLLKNCITLIQFAESCDANKAFKILLQWIALRVGVNGVVFKAKIETDVALKENFDLDLLKSSVGDWLGEVYYELGLQPKNSPQPFTYDEAKSKAKSLKFNRKDQFPETILDTEAGTGRTLMAIYKHRKGHVMLYGIEKDKMLFRICLVNLALYGVNAKVILANNNIDGNKIEAGNPVWEYANNWYGNKID